MVTYRFPKGKYNDDLVFKWYDGGRMPVVHVDLYRISGPHEACDLGLEEYLYGPGITAIEWPERADELLPAETLHVRISAGSGEQDRRLTFEARA